MNTRLQVEHPVTEATTGLDLVELQLQVADGGRLRRRTAAVARALDRGPALRRGPGQGLAAAGRHGAPLRRARHAQRSSRSLDRTGVRLDSGVVDGSVVSVYYDPMLAKVISYAPTRRQAARAAGRRAGPHPHPRRAHQPRPAGQRAAPSGVPRRRAPTPRSSTPTAWPSWPRRWPTTRRRVVGAGGRAGRCRRQPPGCNGFRRRAQRLAQRRVGLQTKSYSRQHGRDARGPATGSPAPAWNVPDYDAVRLVSASPDAGGAGGRRRGPAVRRRRRRYGDDVFVDSPLGPVSARRRCPGSSNPTAALAQGSLLAPMPGSVIRVGAAARRHASPRASR